MTETIKYNDRGLLISESISDEQLKEEIKTIFHAKESLPFSVGDLLVFLEKRSKAALEKKANRQPYNREHIGIYKSLLDSDKSNKSYLITCKKVCTFFPLDKRSFKLPFRTYSEAVYLTKEVGKATELLTEASEKKWSYRELRKTVRERQALASGNVNKEKPNAVAEIVKLSRELQRKLRGDLSKADKEFLFKELSPIAKWVNEGTI